MQFIQTSMFKNDSDYNESMDDDDDDYNPKRKQGFDSSPYKTKKIKIEGGVKVSHKFHFDEDETAKKHN